MIKDKVYIVGNGGPEHNEICSVHKTKEGAVKAWNKHRLELLKDAKESLGRRKDNDDVSAEISERIIKNLSCEDPDKIDNFPHETPYIEERSVEE